MRLHTWPDPVLLEPTIAVDRFDDSLAERVERMYDLMHDQAGVGLAAPQAGWSVRLLVINPSSNAQDLSSTLTVINPRVLKRWGASLHLEGCLSFPEIFVEIERPAGIRLAWQDVQGAAHEEDFEEFPARILQHEMDHLEGVLLVHRMSPVDRIRYRRELEELKARALASG